MNNQSILPTVLPSVTTLDHNSILTIIYNIHNNRMLAWLFDIGMAVAPVTGYVMQYRLIRANKSVGAFSKDICLVLLFANILRINFFIFRQYELALLFQSLFMIAAQVMMVKVCAEYQEGSDRQISEEVLQGEKTEEESEDFWRWSDFQTYAKYIGGFAAGSLLISLLMKAMDFSSYGELIGIVALLSESLLILPQIIQIFKQQRVGGISYMLIFFNLFGDVIKMYYFFLKDQPSQFKLCGGVQLFLDSFVVVQIAYFKWKEGLEEIQEVEGQEQQMKLKDKTAKDSITAELQGSISQSIVLQENLQEIDRNTEPVSK